MLQQTSLLAFHSLERLNTKQKACYDQINREGRLCNREIADLLNWPINRVTPRVLELREQGHVEEAYKDLDPTTNRTVIFWKVR